MATLAPAADSAAETGRALSRYSQSSFRLRRFWSRSPCLGLEHGS